MKHFILVGLETVDSFQQSDWTGLERALKDSCSGDIISFDYLETDSLQTLLSQLNGWSEFIELSGAEIKEIEQNTSIVFDKSENLKLPIYWSVLDFITLATQNFIELKSDHPKEFESLENWEQFYDKSKFANELERMISGHDAGVGITWQTLEYHLGNCEIKK